MVAYVWVEDRWPQIRPGSSNTFPTSSTLWPRLSDPRDALGGPPAGNVGRAQWVASEGRFRPEAAGPAGRNADGAAAVGAGGQRHHPRGDGGGGGAAGGGPRGPR